jgi:hypothetical protein
MLSWICPDCGCDCAPAEHECPDCTDLVQAGMLALAEAVQAQLRALPPPVEIPLQDFIPVALRVVEPRAPVASAPRLVEPEPQATSVPRPLMPIAWVAPPLETSPPLPEPAAQATAQRVKVPTWLVSFIVATVLCLGGAVLVRNMAADHRLDVPASVPASGIAQGLPQNSPPQNAFVPYVEVTGLRVLVDLKHTSQVRYLIVNHSQTLLSNLALRIMVHSTIAPSGAKPLFTVSALVTGLAPYESREVVAEIEELRATDIPDWDHLKTEVQVVQ